MGWNISTDPEDFNAAASLFRHDLQLTQEEFEELLDAARQRAFTLGGVTDLQLVSDVWQALKDAEDEGLAFADFREEFGDSLYEAWGGRQPWRLDMIFRTNVQQGYALGRWGEMTKPHVLEARPFWEFGAIEDQRICPDCENADTTVLPADDRWWGSHLPPLHPACRCTHWSLSPEEAQAHGIDTAGPKDSQAADGFGEAPDLSEWHPDLSEYPRELVEIYRQAA